MCEAFKFLEQ